MNDFGQWQEQAAHRLLSHLMQRTAASEAVGILQVWHAYPREQARDDLDVTGTPAGREAEARRIIAVVDNAADARADRDAHWDPFER
ncbi:hypothetical protein AB0J40_41020 [Amycolatopsis sp. NPDC049691]|uniref:hypothetical protein n=1 Tax=Amycolatopsis sp. NPDC049691 TaxID=3155155 RepID=UPI0034229162